MATIPREVRYLAVARRSDKVIVASKAVSEAEKKQNHPENILRILNSPGWASVTSDKLSLDDGNYQFYVLIDEAGRVYFAITTKTYPSRFIYGSADGSTKGLLPELKKSFGERFGEMSMSCAAGALDSKAKGLLQTLFEQFNDLSSMDKVANVQAKLDAVTGVMQKNVEMALKNTDMIENIDEKAEVLADSANSFKNKATSLKRGMRCRYLKMIIIFSLLAAGVLAAIIAPLAIKNEQSK